MILCPSGGGKTTFIESNYSEYNGYELICNEHLSSSNYTKKGIKMGSTATIVPQSHPLYLDWNDMYKIGLDSFYSSQSFDKSCLIYNCTKHISMIKTDYPELDLCIVLPEFNLHKGMLAEKINSLGDFEGKKLAEYSIMELVEKDHPILPSLNLYSWTRTQVEREEYKRISNLLNVNIFTSFEEALCG